MSYTGTVIGANPNPRPKSAINALPGLLGGVAAFGLIIATFLMVDEKANIAAREYVLAFVVGAIVAVTTWLVQWVIVLRTWITHVQHWIDELPTERELKQLIADLNTARDTYGNRAMQDELEKLRTRVENHLSLHS